MLWLYIISVIICFSSPVYFRYKRNDLTYGHILAFGIYSFVPVINIVVCIIDSLNKWDNVINAVDDILSKEVYRKK